MKSKVRAAFFTGYVILFAFVLVTFASLWVPSIVELEKEVYQAIENRRAFYLASSALPWLEKQDESFWKEKEQKFFFSQKKRFGFLCRIEVAKPRQKRYNIYVYPILEKVSSTPKVRAILERKNNQIHWIQVEFLP